ncbi:squalene-hopene/tetraprenyl-beta-curcumene cyclase [Sphingomonas vulcanisoli]|uniref:Squalene-hopene/tetraprenyl-beta-curcumene cyclase n=1 Tax=Sphingomonas vulcanisoli TaxID=1658060 RepID=A0ABX0TQN8_9SPHN|nr:squalene--hopene cyclase [Sphingomonas vulcanisoli]NIJ07846.1 squalene-hopene/tetraprenyl-beta-curcumene cyclase [Sphingomonas vulcanisoli]
MLTTADLLSGTPALDRVEDAVASAAQALKALQKPDGHWVFELEADATIPAEYILLRHYLGEPDDLALEAAIGRYLRRIQGDHGGWPLFHGGALDLSATVKAYYALKMIGDDPQALHMARARAEILKRGGAVASNVFTRIQLALFGAGSWAVVPEVPVELMLVPKNFPIHIAKISYWARTVMVPLLVLAALRPIAKNPRGIRVDELYVPGARPPASGAHAHRGWAFAFNMLDRGLKMLGNRWPKRLRARAIEAARTFVVERLNGEDGLGAIYPAMANSVMMFDCLGYTPDHPDRAIARQSVENLLVRREDGEVYCQPCVSPIWDSALAAHAMLEAGEEASAGRALDWLAPKQVLDVEGDWAWQRPGLRPGGWAFQYNNAYYPDTDDTAAVALAMDRAAPGKFEEAIERAREWTLGMQSSDGGWGAFDIDNSHHYLNNIPFSDHGALLDPPTVDVAARCISFLAQRGNPDDKAAIDRGVAFIAKEQEKDGSWFGRWGVNHIYGTWSALSALNAAGVPADTPMIRRAVAWLEAIQNEDGGWGEGCESYALDRACHTPFPSSASQTAWALIGLMAAGEVDSPAVARGVAWLLAHQDADGLWGQEVYTGGGFPRVFYLRYHGYPKFFPLWALARYRNLQRGNSRDVAWGI